ncbi:MAG: type I 3-dehydroquinate dehydratase [Acidobacteria bacterium]|nr:type I 3-dehydroquinate dehydratase [Acidobacteriota bacterium]MCY3966053.1 type I 3-dehydroquinate dehydratase [Acidobacteriota bacterium]
MNPTTDEPRTATPAEVAARATLVASLTEAPSASGDEVRALSELADCLEVRADLVGAIDPGWLRERFAGELLYTLRSEAEGGHGPVDADRREKLLAAGAGYDLIDLEADRDLVSGVLDAVEPRRRLVSWHGRAGHLKALRSRLKQASATEARLYKLVTAAERSGEELAPLELLLGEGREDVVAFSMGAVGAWTRLLAPRLGAPWVYGAAGSVAAAPGQPSVERLRADYGLPSLPPVARLFGVVGHPAAHSMSPRLHNAGYRARSQAALYVAFDAPSFETFWEEVVLSDFLERAGLPLGGLSVTAPHKAAALAAASEAGDAAVRAAGANTLLPAPGAAAEKRWRAESTDPEGVVGPLRRRGIETAGRTALVIGAGGAGRAAVAGLAAAGADVSLANRTVEAGEAAAESLAVSFVPLTELDPGPFDIVVNATSLGGRPGDPLPCDPDALRPSAVGVELVYGGGPTPWSRALGALGVPVVDGREVLLHQGLAQFKAMTGGPLPFEVGAAALGLETQR